MWGQPVLRYNGSVFRTKCCLLSLTTNEYTLPKSKPRAFRENRLQFWKQGLLEYWWILLNIGTFKILVALLKDLFDPLACVKANGAGTLSEASMCGKKNWLLYLHVLYSHMCRHRPSKQTEWYTYAMKWLQCELLLSNVFFLYFLSLPFECATLRLCQSCSHRCKSLLTLKLFTS